MAEHLWLSIGGVCCLSECDCSRFRWGCLVEYCRIGAPADVSGSLPWQATAVTQQGCFYGDPDNHIVETTKAETQVYCSHLGLIRHIVPCSSSNTWNFNCISSSTTTTLLSPSVPDRLSAAIAFLADRRQHCCSHLSRLSVLQTADSSGSLYSECYHGNGHSGESFAGGPLLSTLSGPVDLGPRTWVRL